MNENKNLTTEETFALAVQNHKSNNFQVAEDLYTQILEINPNHANTLNNLGLIFARLKKYQKSRDYYEKAIKIIPNHADAHNNLGIIFKELDEPRKARACYEKAIEINPNHADAYNNLGIIFGQKGEGNLPMAINCYEKAIKINPNHVDAYNNLGIIFYRLKKYQKLINCYNKLIEINPINANTHNNLGVIFSEIGENKKAISSYEKAIEINPNFIGAYRNLGVIFKKLREFQRAKKFYKKAIEINPNNADIYYELGRVFKELGENQNARTCYEKAIEINPNDTKLSNSLLQTLYNLNEQSTLFKELDRRIKIGKVDAVIGSIYSRLKIKNETKTPNPFCNDPLKYVLKTDLTERYDFKNIFIKTIKDIIKNDSTPTWSQDLLTNGYQTAGNLFDIYDDSREKIKNIIHSEVNRYLTYFKGSEEGFIRNWPAKYFINGWIIGMKSGGKLSAHMHDKGWLSGSIYINIPPKLRTDSGNLVVCIDDKTSEKKDLLKSINVVTGSLCLFPSSLFHYTIPFEYEEDRIVLAFDVTPN